MTETLLAALDRLPPRVRRFVVAAGALLALGAVMAALTLSAPRSGRERRRAPPASGCREFAAEPAAPTPAARPAAAMRDARRVAERFLAGYLPFAYGRRSAFAVGDVTPALRRQLRRERAQLTPVERRRRPRVVSLQTVGTTPAFVVATAVIDDGELAPSIACSTAARNSSFFSVFTPLSIPAGKTNSSKAKTRIFEHFRMSADCNASCVFRSRRFSRSVRPVHCAS